MPSEKNHRLLFDFVRQGCSFSKSVFLTSKSVAWQKQRLMLIIEVKEGENIDRALKRYKRKVKDTGILKELRSRKQFTKPSVKRRNEVLKAKYIENVRRELG